MMNLIVVFHVLFALNTGTNNLNTPTYNSILAIL